MVTLSELQSSSVVVKVNAVKFRDIQDENLLCSSCSQTNTGQCSLSDLCRTKTEASERREHGVGATERFY